MIKFTIYLCFIFVCLKTYAGNKPIDSSHKIQAFTEGHFFKILNGHQILGDFKAAEWEENQFFFSSKLGIRKSLSAQFKMGLFLQRSYGNRNDNDWVKDINWHWRDHSNFGEDSFLMDAFYKNFLTTQLIYELRLSFEHNWTLGRNILRPRIATTYFLNNSHITLLHELSIPFDKRDKMIQEYWTYLSFNYHITANFLLGPLLAFRESHWETSSDFNTKVKSKYLLDEQTLYAGVNFVYYL